MLLTDLMEVKALLSIDPSNTEDDKLINFLIEQASSWMEELANRKFLYKSRTEYYNGTGTQKLLLRSRPVFTTPTIEVYVDNSGLWGATSGAFASSTQLTYGDDFGLWIDQEDGTSRSGILVRKNALWDRNSVRQTGLLAPFMYSTFGGIKVVYTAGYTISSLPADLRFAAMNLIARMRYLLPLGMELSSESYQERSISILSEGKHALLSESGVRPILQSHRNWTWGQDH